MIPGSCSVFPGSTMKWATSNSLSFGLYAALPRSPWRFVSIATVSSCERHSGGPYRALCHSRRGVRAREIHHQRSSIPWNMSRLVPRAVEIHSEVGKDVQSKLEEAYEAVIGIECHIQLNTASKAFCSCKNEYGGSPNEFVCPVCMGHPGTLPVLNAEMVHKAVMTGLALNATIAVESTWDRKQYFYPDLPKGYQITQYEVPIVSNGYLDILLPDARQKRVSILRAHLEEDAGKLSHIGAKQLSGSDYSIVDYNRAGVPLLEIVSGPDMGSGLEAAAYGEELRRVVTYLGVSLANMQDGGMRCDVNISVRRAGEPQLGTKVEIKNMNSFAAMQKAIDYEFQRQAALLEAGRAHEIVQETRLFDEAQQTTYSMRKKEGLADYRYFPEPDLGPVVITDEYVSAVESSMPELPGRTRERFLQLGLPLADVLVLTDEPGTARFYDAVLLAGAPAKAASNWVIGDLMAHCKATGSKMLDLRLKPQTLAAMISLIERDVISGKIAKQLLPDLLKGEGEENLEEYVKERGLVQVSDPAAIEALVDKVLASNPKQLEQYRSGKTKLQAFFVGQLMKESKGKANPALLNKLLQEKLDAK